MKTIKLFTMLFLLLSVSIQAQDVKNQSEIIKENLKVGDYKIIADAYGSPSGVMNFNEISPDKSKPEDNLKLVVQRYPGSATESTREERTTFFADKEIFPVTYMSTSYEGNKKMQEQNGYVVRRGRSAGEYRFVFLENYIFYIVNWKNKDDYTVQYILRNGEKDVAAKKEKKKKKGGFFKRMKEGMKSASANGGRGGSNAKIEKLKIEILQPYLDAATAMQKKLESSPEAMKAKQNAAAINAKMDESIDSYNNVVYVNKTGRTIYIYRGKSTKAAMYGNGVKVKFPCTSGLNYDFTGKKWYYPNKVINLNTAGTTDKCGKTVEIK